MRPGARLVVWCIVALGACAGSAQAQPFGFAPAPVAASGAGAAGHVLTLRRAGAAVQLLERGRAVRSPATSPGVPLRIAGTAGNDTLRVDFSRGTPAPAGLVFDGGAQAGGAGDGLEIVGGRFGRVRVTF